MEENKRKPPRIITSEQAREMGLKSVEAKKRRRETKVLLDYVLQSKETDPKIIKRLKEMGFSECLTNNLSMVVRMLLEAKGGNVNAARLLWQLHGDLDEKKETSETIAGPQIIFKRVITNGNE